MNKEMIIDPEIKAMFELLAEDASTMEACMAKIKCSLSIAAELFHINKVELKLEAPVSKLCPEGQRAVQVFMTQGMHLTVNRIFRYFRYRPAER